MLFRVLGPLEVEFGPGEVVAPSGARARALLAALLLDPGAVVPVHRLAEMVWGEVQPESVENAVHVAVARLRRALGPAGACVVTRPPGYLMDLRGARVDADLFEQRCRAGQARMDTDPGEAVRLLEEALALWRGPAFGELAEEFARPAAVRLEELRRGAAEYRAEALLRAGSVEQALAAAGDLAAAHPLAERPVSVLVRGLAAAGRTADALEAYRRLADVLREELGLDPSPELRELHARLLREELVAPAPVGVRLPRRPSPLVGRDEELRAVAAALADAPLVTLTGPGGVGKTRLALELAHAVVAEGRCVWWVDLVPVPPPRVAEAVAAATGVEIVPGGDPVGALCATLARARGLLVLDNAEHVLDPVAELAEQLLAEAPHLTVLVTSRERLALDQEAVRALPPLPVPVGADPMSPSVRLFLARAGALPELAGGDGHGGVALVAELCRRLDGLPLAIELGAARAAALGLPALAERLGDRLDLLGGGRRTADRRHRTLRGVLEWSHELLAPAEAVLFRRLGVFPAGFALAQAEAVCADGRLPQSAVPALLARLVEQSLVQRGPDHRFALLETLRAYAVEQLDAAGETRLRDRHARDTAARLTAETPRLWTENEPVAVRALHTLTPDLHAAWAHAAEHDRDLALQMVADVYDFAYFRQRLDLLGWGLTAAAWQIEEPRHAPALATAAAALWSAGRLAEAAETAERSIALAGGRDAPGAALALNVSGDIAMFLGRTADAVERYRRHGALADPVGRRVPRLVTALSIAHALINGRRRDEAAAVLADVAPQALRTGNPTTLAWAHYLNGELVNDTDPERAAGEYRAAVACGTPADSRLFVTMARSSAAALAARTGDPNEAFTALEQVLDEWLRLGNTAAAFFLIQHVAVALSRAGADHDVAIIAGAVHAHVHQMPGFAVDAERLTAALAQVRARLGDTATDTALAQGEALSLPATLTMARRALAAQRSRPAPSEPTT
ncbi:BTAD domain-containing putative transcriptional regulator [Pseudonocardia charpentierae]|uniref:BTAD domain-containing putative transcriptional regulator n=1 Tax=Pseudonocardia charpentierae TaxID=3075545 RepID=A0ABU2NIN4_9PSEU|nr:BTAD domain-containing putative transcriptional regulator [Pseudonocardia sp. DSM 45834]MDT0353826.1 BTAD domain-containing putative transcriptional regulator [Pseudonocardia sp. DSM 45834]